MKNSRGLTLIEIIVYTAIIAVVFILVVNSLAILMKSFNHGRLSVKIANSAEIAMERMAREIKFANNIDPSSILGSHPGHLILNTYVLGTEILTTIEFFIDSGKLMVKEGASAAESLSAPDLIVANLVFRQIDTTQGSKAVKIEITITGSSGNYQETQNIYNTIVLRESY